MGRPLASYISDLETVLTAFQRVGAAVIVGNLPDLSSLPFFAEASGDPAALQAECARWNEAITEVAQRYGATVVDFFPDPIDPATIGSDGFHPSEEGQRRLAERFREAIR
jgi:lysophospholipase L1-like esterase